VYQRRGDGAVEPHAPTVLELLRLSPDFSRV
jgi:hypothetical protein